MGMPEDATTSRQPAPVVFALTITPSTSRASTSLAIAAPMMRWPTVVWRRPRSIRMRMLTGSAVMAIHSPTKIVRWASSPSMAPATTPSANGTTKPIREIQRLRPRNASKELFELDLHFREQHQHQDADVGDGCELRRFVYEIQQ